MAFVKYADVEIKVLDDDAKVQEEQEKADLYKKNAKQLDSEENFDIDEQESN